MQGAAGSFRASWCSFRAVSAKPVEVTIETMSTRSEPGMAIADNGVRYAFDDYATPGRPELQVGQRCFVLLQWPGPKEHRALLLRATPGAYSDDILAARTVGRGWAFSAAPRFVPAPGPSPVELVRSLLPIPDVVFEWLTDKGRKRLAARVPKLDFGGLSLGDFWQTELLEPASMSFDPCYVPFGGADGDTLGLYFYPPAVERGVVPVLFAFHEEDPAFTWVAESADALESMVASKTKPKAAKPRWDAEVATAIAALAKAPGRGKQPLVRERYLVWKLNQAGVAEADEAIVEELRGIYRELGWAGALAILDEARRVTPRTGGDPEELKKAIEADFDGQLANVEVLSRYARR